MTRRRWWLLALSFAVRGSFLVETPPAGGTRVLAEIPCDA
jgi:hypothetical protein